ncbi:hypothetical protein Zmor_025095 [Zophobas morio]|uniref:Uncharacterized protein n=2 Tax=Zophobas morio TaxID=2755281 RepID=A0AA38HQW2_9CUCU|nr:hypothetical protein Zmor_025095 [Zophobas morio]
MVKSKSAYVIKKKYQIDNDEQKEVERRRNDLTKKITREPISVPNFSALTLPTPALTPVEATKLVYLDTDDENEIMNDSYPNDTIQVGKRASLSFNNPPKRGESYNSHLGYADNPLYQHMMKLQNEQENVSSTSDYASIETMNRLSSASNYSVKTNHDENQKNREKDGPFGFCNPNYMGPDIKHVAKLLTHQSSLGVQSSEEDLLELQEYNGVINRNTKVLYRSSLRNHPSNFPALDNVRPKDSKRRAHSAGRAERIRVEKTMSDETDFDRILDYVPLYVYIIGGKEHGQVTIFQRPISIWKLKLF